MGGGGGVTEAGGGGRETMKNCKADFASLDQLTAFKKPFLPKLNHILPRFLILFLLLE